MIWSPAKLHIQSVNLDNAQPTRPTVSMMLIGGGFVDNVDVFIVHDSVTAAQLITAIQDDSDSPDGILYGTEVEHDAMHVSCKADMTDAKQGTYDVVAVQIVDESLQVAMKAAAFEWR